MILVNRAFEDDGDVVQAAVDLDVASRPDIVALFRIVAVVRFPRVGERDAQIKTRIDPGAMFSASRYSQAMSSECVDRSECVWCYDRLGASPGGLKLVNLTESHLARKMARRDKRHRRSGRPVVQHDIQKTRFIKNLKRGRPACEATAEGCTPEEMERWAGIS